MKDETRDFSQIFKEHRDRSQELLDAKIATAARSRKRKADESMIEATKPKRTKSL